MTHASAPKSTTHLGLSFKEAPWMMRENVNNFHSPHNMPGMSATSKNLSANSSLYSTQNTDIHSSQTGRAGEPSLYASQAGSQAASDLYSTRGSNASGMSRGSNLSNMSTTSKSSEAWTSRYRPLPKGSPEDKYSTKSAQEARAEKVGGAPDYPMTAEDTIHGILRKAEGDRCAGRVRGVQVRIRDASPLSAADLNKAREAPTPASSAPPPWGPDEPIAALNSTPAPAPRPAPSTGWGGGGGVAPGRCGGRVGGGLPMVYGTMC